MEKKCCTKCKQNKEIEYFTKKGDFQVQSWCKDCKSKGVMNKIQEKRVKAKMFYGGKCSKCGYNKCLGALEFHHPNNNKEYTVANMFSNKSWEKIQKEIEKCILICSNCHKELHYITPLV